MSKPLDPTLRKLLEDALDTITEAHLEGMTAWMGPMEIQRRILVALGRDPEAWRRVHYG